MGPKDNTDPQKVKDFYNTVGDLDGDISRTESRIKGLRAFNNWIKSDLIQRFAVLDNPSSGRAQDSEGLRVLEIGCGKGGYLHKWHQAPANVAIYVGLDPADVSIQQAQRRWEGYQDSGKYGFSVSRAESMAQDCFGETLEGVPIIQEVGFSREAGGGFDVVSMMFCMHYAFVDEDHIRMMLDNITGALKPGGRLIGCVPNSKVIRENIRHFEATIAELGSGEDQPPVSFGNDLYNVRFEGQTPSDGVFGRPFGHRYFFTLAEAVEAPEYVVPWELFCNMAKEYNLELQYSQPLDKVWEESKKKNNGFLAAFSEEMGVVDAQGKFLVSDQEMEVAKFYLAFCFFSSSNKDYLPGASS